MSRTNCKNCGAALDIWKPKCEFCGTKNVNLTAIDLASGEPANFIFKMPSNIKVVNKNNESVYLSLLAVPSLEMMTMRTEPVTVYGGWSDKPLAQYTGGSSLEMELKLNTVSHRVNDKEVMAELRVGDEK